MKPRNFPARKLQRTLRAMDWKESKSEWIKLEEARKARTKKKRSV